MKYPILLVLLFAANPAVAGTPTAAPAEAPPDALDRLWALRKFYDNEANPSVQEVSFSAFYAGQYYGVRGNGGDNDDGWDHRRLRWGLRAKVLQNFYLRAEISSRPEDGDFYAGIWNASITWKPSDAFELAIGKFRPCWSLEGEDSTMNLNTMERTMLANESRPGNVVGLAVDGDLGQWSYEVGVFSADEGDAFGNFNGGAMASVSIGYDFNTALGVEKAKLRLDYLYGDVGENSDGKGPWKHNVALNFDWENGPWEWRAEALALAGGTATAFGFMIEPSYFVTEKLQLVLRYQIAASNGDSLRQQPRFERILESTTDKGHGHFYQAAYFGANWHVKRNRLKFMTGVEWANMDGGGDGGGFHGWTWLGGVRVQF
jgi:hypothetical protein